MLKIIARSFFGKVKLAVVSENVFSSVVVVGSQNFAHTIHVLVDSGRLLGVHKKGSSAISSWSALNAMCHLPDCDLETESSLESGVRNASLEAQGRSPQRPPIQTLHYASVCKNIR